MERYIHESSKTYRDCEIQNNAHQSLLERKTLGLELERRKTSLYLSREEHQLREQLKQMQIAKAKNELAQNSKDIKTEKTSPVEIRRKIPTEPYPVTFRSNTPSPVEHGKHMEKYGRSHGFRRKRKPSREFEDVSLETGSKSLFSSNESSEHRRRVNSLTHAQKPNLGFSQKPSLRRSVLDSRHGRGVHSRDASRESLNNGSINSLEKFS